MLILLVFWCLWFLNFSSRSILSPLLPIIEEELAITHATAGSLFIFLSAGYTISLILAGFVSHRFGYKRTIMGGFLILTIAHLSFVKAHSYWALSLFLLFVGVGTGIYIPSIIPIITATFERRKWGKTIALHDTAAPVGIFAVPILVALSLRFAQWRVLFPILGGTCLAGLILFGLFSPDPRAEIEDRPRFVDVLQQREFWIMAVLWVFAVACNAGVYNVIPLFLVKERGMSLTLANTVFGISRIAGPVVTVLAGFLADRYGARKTLFLGFLIIGASTVGLALARSFSLLVVMMVVQATVSLAPFPVGLVIISRLTDLRARSIFTGGTIACGIAFGLGLTPVVLGAAADVWSFKAGILVLGIMTVLASFSVRGLRGI
jgi:NNP family nitrate/nitrite transporter-like MFS transporter